MTDPVAAAIEPIREKFVQAYTQWLPEMQSIFPGRQRASVRDPA